MDPVGVSGHSGWMPKLWRALLLVLVSVTFTAAGVWMGVAGDALGEAAAVTAFFGLCSAIALFFLVQHLREARNAGLDGDVLAAPGRIREDRRLLVGGGGALAVAGTVMALGGRSLGWPFVACAVALHRPHPGAGDRSVLELFPMSFGLDAGLLARSIDGYARNPARRAELDQRRRLQAET